VTRAEEAVARCQRGQGVAPCTADEYPAIRAALQTAAATWIDQGQTVYAWVAFNEIRRLDQIYPPPRLFLDG
jgi:hypothetical protein